MGFRDELRMVNESLAVPQVFKPDKVSNIPEKREVINLPSSDSEMKDAEV